MDNQPNNRIREEWYEYLRSIIKNRDYIPEDAIDGAGDWWLSKIAELLKSQREEMVEKIKEETGNHYEQCDYDMNYEQILQLIDNTIKKI